MASGLSKTKWNGQGLEHEAASNGSSLDVTLSYEGKKSQDAILGTEPAILQSQWQGTATDNRLYFGDNLPS
jgi:hypothetical protein